jgi:RNA polymerase sigma-70 factor (ECF subfamily)
VLAETSFDKGLRGKADPSDVVQEAMLKASERFPQFRGETEGGLVSWLRRILARGLADPNRRFRANAARA